MSNVEEIFNKIGSTETDHEAPTPEGVRYRLTKRDLVKALAAMPDNAAIWNTVPGQSEHDAKTAIREALWATLESAVKPMVVTPTGEYIEGKP